MTSEDLLAVKIRKSLIIECSEDHVGLWSIIWEFREIALEKSTLKRRQKTMSLVKQLLEEELIQAGILDLSNGQFQKWKLPTHEIISKIEKEWDNLGREPNIWEIVWFTATEKGRKEAARLRLS